MDITEEDLKVILENGGLAQEDKNILIDFCNSFHQVFSDFVDKDEFLKRISTFKRMKYEHKGDKADATYSQDGTLTINDDLHGNRRKAIVYHELMHLISMHLPRENTNFGIVQGFKMGSIDMNEIMTEYFSTRLLLHESIDDLKGKVYISRENGIEEYVEHDGTGYPPAAKLGELYHKIFGEEIVDGYFNNAIRFQQMFNERYYFLDDGEMTPMENAVDLWGNIYKNYANALRIFMTNENEKLTGNNLTIYDYLRESKIIKDCLPVREDTTMDGNTTTGIPAGVEKFLLKLDERFVARTIRPDVVGKPQNADELRKKKDFFIALNAIRDNIEYLSPEDIENIDMNFQYTPDSKNMSILVNGKLIQVFTDGETYLGTSEIEKEHTEIQNSQPGKEIQPKSTPAMDEYMTFIFQKVMDLYKEVFPGIMSQALGIGIDEVSSIGYDDIMKKLNNMTIDYRLVEKPEDMHISYRDYIRDNVMANLMGRTPSGRNDKLSIHLYEPDISEQTSVSDMMNMIDKDGIPKVLSDINYISHEMAHAFEHILKAQNPSYIDSGALSIQNNVNGKVSIDYDPGESFAVSMERIILDKLKESGKLEQYGLSAYMNVEDIENLWQERRINHYEKDFGIVGHASDGQVISYLDLDLIPYNIMKNQGTETMLQYIKSLNFYKIGSAIPAVDDIGAISKFCDDIRREGYEEYLIDSIQGYQPIFSQEDILSIINQTRQPKKESLFLPQEIGKATVNTPTDNKDEAKKHIQRDEQIIQQSQEIDDTRSK